VNRAERRLNAQHDDQAFDLAPAAVMQVIADMAAGFCSVRRLYPGCFAEPVDQGLCFDNIAGFDIKRQIHMGAVFLMMQAMRLCGGRIAARRRLTIKAIG
jgi:hypothetical protein